MWNEKEENEALLGLWPEQAVKTDGFTEKRQMGGGKQAWRGRDWILFGVCWLLDVQEQKLSRQLYT